MIQDPHRRTRAIIFNCLSVVFGGGLFIYFSWALRPLILPIVLGVLLAFLFRPLKSAFKYHWLPESLRLFLLFGFLIVGLLGSINFIRANIPNEKENLEIQVRLKYKMNQKFNELMGIDPLTGKGNSFYNLVAQDVNPLLKLTNSFLNFSDEQRELFLRYRQGVAGYEPVPDTYYQYYLINEKNNLTASKSLEHKKVEGSSAPAPIVANVGNEKDHSLILELMDLVSIWIVMPFVFVFFLIDEDSITQFCISLVPNRFFELALTLKEKVDIAIGEYLRGISLECGLVGISLALGFYLMGIPLNMSLMIGALSGLATAIPFFGPIVGIVFGLVYVLIAEHLDPIIPLVSVDNSPLAVIIVNLIVLGLDNLVFQPIVLGGAVNLHPLVIVIGLTGGSMLFGLAGVLLAIPAIVVFKVVISITFRGLREYRII